MARPPTKRAIRAEVARLQEQFRQTGKFEVLITTSDNTPARFLCIALSAPDAENPEMLLALNGVSSYIYDGKSPISPFTLMTHRFDFVSSGAICNLINEFLHFSAVALKPPRKRHPKPKAPDQ